MNGNYVITIGREFGSGGREIGRILAEKLNIKCYDKELLALSAKESGLSEELFKFNDEKPTNSFLYSLVMDIFDGIFRFIICGCTYESENIYGTI